MSDGIRKVLDCDLKVSYNARKVLDEVFKLSDGIRKVLDCDLNVSYNARKVLDEFLRCEMVS